MASLEFVLKDLLDVVEHIARTHPSWNEELTHDMAMAKVAKVRAALVAHDVEEAAKNVADDVTGENDGGDA